VIKINNTLSGKLEEFKPNNKNFVSMYVCGVTPYDEIHLGHARVYVVFDVIKRHLLNRGYKVKHIQNFTDIDDKIIKKAKEKKINPHELANIFIIDYFKQTDKLNILRAEKYPRVTEMINEIIFFIKKLIDIGIAYEINGDVYFSVMKIKNYGILSKIKLSGLKIGSRIAKSDKKKTYYDFVLWKNTDGKDIGWDSPWGKGRPGWHIECSVIILSLLGETIDIHGGGQDLIFPHHENEIAQSEAITGKCFVKYWIHNGFITVNKEKMSKSLNNFFSLKEIFKKYEPRIVRYYLLTQRYSIPLNFSYNGLDSAKNTLSIIDETYLKLCQCVNESVFNVIDNDLKDLNNKFLNSLDKDFNYEIALSYVHKLKNIILNDINYSNKKRLLQLKNLFEKFLENSLGIVLPKYKKLDGNLQDILKKRDEARKNKNWIEADKLRNIINKKGYEIIDNKHCNSIAIKNKNKML
jgi:cysteinyl-tRNA synthetase